MVMRDHVSVRSWKGILIMVTKLPRGNGTIIRPRRHTAACKRGCGHGYGVRYPSLVDGSPVEEYGGRGGNWTEEQAFERLLEVKKERELADAGASTTDKEVPAWMYIRDHIEQRIRIAEGTKTKYRYLVRNFMEPIPDNRATLDYDIGKLHPFRVREYVAHLRRINLPENEISQLLSIIRMACKVAQADRLLDVDPTLGIEVLRHVAAARHIPTTDQVRGMLSAATPLGKDLILFACGTGLRLGELLGVEESCYLGDVIRVRRQFMHTGKWVNHLKSKAVGESRDVPVSDRVREIIERRLSENPPGGFLFAHTYKRIISGSQPRPIHRTQVGNELAIARAGTDDPDGHFTMHTFRHYFASQLLGSDPPVPIQEVAEFLGHENIQMTYQTYHHLIQPSFDRAMGVLNQSMSVL